MARVGRKLGCEVINLGFSGNGQMEPEVASLLAEQDPDVFVIDCLPNMTADLIAERAGHLVKTIRATRTDPPILLVEDRTYGDARFVPSRKERNETSRVAFRDVYDSLIAEGVSGLTYMEGASLLGDDDTVDGSHPTDLGFKRQADRFVDQLSAILG